jgi:hypothetical protein
MLRRPLACARVRAANSEAMPSARHDRVASEHPTPWENCRYPHRRRSWTGLDGAEHQDAGESRVAECRLTHRSDAHTAHSRMQHEV